ncbi:MAG TPA: hypothetical protein PLV72_00795 [Candidatus Magasanikbacteria bacterium]|nr:hypothetical protein [Candidatus Magasanikbacteria bacterium]
MNRNYVISEDIYLLLSIWVREKNYTLPPKLFFENIRKEFFVYMQKIFPGLIIVPESSICSGLRSLLLHNKLPTISLERTYFAGDLSFEITRLVDKNHVACGWGNRTGTLPIEDQLRALQNSDVSEVVLVDDVIFEGKTLKFIIDLFSSIGIRVISVYAGIGIGEMKIVHQLVRNVNCVYLFEDVIDEVCERDFFPGVPLSGRLLINTDYGIPYVYPFGNPIDWASIPLEHGRDFSKFCIHQTIKIFEEIERRSDRPIYCHDLARQIIGLKTNDRFVNCLRAI